MKDISHKQIKVSVANNTLMTAAVARAILEYHTAGPILIVVEKPVIFLSVLRKQWLKLGRRLQIDRARTIDPTKIAYLTQNVSTIYTLRFCATTCIEEVEVVLVDPTEKSQNALFTTLLICSSLLPYQREIFTARLKVGATIVDYSPPTPSP